MSIIRNFIYLFLTALMFTSCGKFIKDDEVNLLKTYETKEYKLKIDVSKDEVQLKKGDKVKLMVKTGDESIKVYCLSSKDDFLKAERILILYVFQDDFNDERFDIGVFETKLYETVEPFKR